ncbi:hypothetical protein BJY04DRAFT_197429 [Aspergillus karnatakaensis]|uniref:DUF2423 domain-containing protein n=1 Tax=Aspergillus karnatakaensis TaxID=1810916 RepID=UPI003CCDD4A0
MAKSGRASIIKRNRAKLRSTVFGPAVDARTERLSAKLQELASQPKPGDQEKSKATTDTKEFEPAMANPAAGESMDIDSSKTSTSGKSHRSGRVQKRQKKNSSSIVFKPHPSKTRKFSRKK